MISTGKAESVVLLSLSSVGWVWVLFFGRGMLDSLEDRKGIRQYGSRKRLVFSPEELWKGITQVPCL